MDLPVNIKPVSLWRFCPYCANLLEKRELFGRERLYCPACGNVIFQDPKVGAGVLLEEDGKILLVKRAVPPEKGKWGLPAGFMEWDETPEEAAKRECLEETGLEVELQGLFGIFHYTDDFRGPGIIIIYKAKKVGGNLTPGDDAAEIRFFSPDELPEDIAFETNRKALALWRKRLLSSSGQEKG